MEPTDSKPSDAIPDETRASGSPPPGPLTVPVDLTYELRFEQYRQVATSSIAAAGGVLILLQAGYLESGRTTIMAFATFALASATAIFGQDKLIEGIEKGRGRTGAAKGYLYLTFMLIGAALAMIVDVAMI